MARALIEVLGEYTAAPKSCFVGVWPGFNRKYRQGIPETGRISTRARDWDLFRAPLEAYEAVPEDRFWEDAENPLPPESKHRLGLIADVDMVRFEPLGIRIMRGCYNLLFRLSGGRFPAGGRIIGLK